MKLFGTKDNNTYMKVGNKWNAIIISILAAICMITICSKSSFLYPLNDWVDANCFFTVGKGMMNGKIPYRDLLEQKGPLVYFIHGLAWLISNDSFIGVYFFEVIAGTIFLYYSYRTIEVILEKSVWVLIPIMGVIIFTAKAFCHGDSVEELCLPLLAYAVWLAVKRIKNDEELGIHEYFLTGFCAGCMLWIKFTMTGFYVGWFLLPLIEFTYQKKWKQLVRIIGVIVLGVAVATLPWIIYFGVHGAIGDWLNVYIYHNIFGYTVMNSNTALKNFLINMILGIQMLQRDNIMVLLTCICGLFMAAKPRYKKITIQYCLMFVGLHVFTYMGGRLFPYYSFVYAIFVPFGLVVLYDALSFCLKGNVSWIQKKRIEYVGVICAAIVAFFLTPNRYMMGEKKGNLPQYQFKTIIEQVENPTLLNYGFLDGGFYTVCNIIPDCKAF